MSIIKLTTNINAPADICFDLSRSIDLHLNSMQHTDERAVAGRLFGHMDLNDQVTWEARHFGLKFRMTIRISEMRWPEYFIDEIVKSPFKLLRHLHTFERKGRATVMSDEFIFRSPFGWIGKIVDKFLLEPYMRKLLTKRNDVIKHAAETQARFMEDAEKAIA
ncbi:cell division protein [Mucilaginibacter terrenus]|uniref:Cell division protein n=1 Tax=Mucilaginibacter terrenus TaxID=2482727 RepID=A0A3E2NUA7_9SPHI|nr:SRPBCC family protein [Mucilaginibacter terrenus]RFZ84588.1 cell division protein [Mucilaginibacter terrenus]